MQHAVMGQARPDRFAQAGAARDGVPGLRNDRGRGDVKGIIAASERSLVRSDGRSRPREPGARGARSHAVLRRERRPGRRHGQARRRRLRVRRDRHAEGRRPDRALRATCCEGMMREGRQGDGRASTRRGGTAFAGPTRRRTSCTTRCRRTWARMRSSKARRWMTTGCGSTSRNPVAGDGEQLAAIERDVAERVAAAEPVEVGDAAAGRGPRSRRDDAVRREVSRPGADGVDGRRSAASCAAARISTTRARSSSSRSSAKKASRPARGGSRRSPGRRPRSTCRKTQVGAVEMALTAGRRPDRRAGGGKRLAQQVRDLKKAMCRRRQAARRSAAGRQSCRAISGPTRRRSKPPSAKRRGL